MGGKRKTTCKVNPNFTKQRSSREPHPKNDNGNCDVKSQPGISNQAKAEDMKQQDDDQRLLVIFPEEIWCMILEKFKDSTDLENLSNASSYFRQLLLPRRIFFLFPKMFQILAPEIESYQKFWNYLELLWYRVVLRLRAVCSSWQNGVDIYYNNHWLHYMMEQDHYDGNELFSENQPTLRKILENYKVKQDEPETINRFLAHFQSTHEDNSKRNPFFGRTLILDKFRAPYACYRRRATNEVLNQEAVAFRERISSLMLKYGHHIWNFKICLEDNFLNKMEYLQQLRELLDLMPNLKRLKIDYQAHDITFVIMKPFPSKLWKQMEAELKENPFPKLEHLIFLKTKNLPPPIFNNLITVNNHIAKLEIHRRNNHKRYCLDKIELPNLVEFSWQIALDEDFDLLQATKFNWMQLEKLYLPYESPKLDFDKWLGVFNLCNQKLGSSTKLANLMIELPELNKRPVEYLKKTVALKLDFPNVKRFKLILESPTSLDFLLPMKASLEILDVEVGYLDKEDISRYRHARQSTRLAQKGEQLGVTQFYEWETKLLETNLWTLFPKLAKITRLGFTKDTAWMRGNPPIYLQPFPSFDLF